MQEQAAVNEIEQDANVFALLLLMPKEMIESDLKSIQFNLVDDEPLKSICEKYQVTMTAFTYRVQLLKIHGI